MFNLYCCLRKGIELFPKENQGSCYIWLGYRDTEYSANTLGSIIAGYLFYSGKPLNLVSIDYATRSIEQLYTKYWCIPLDLCNGKIDVNKLLGSYNIQDGCYKPFSYQTRSEKLKWLMFYDL